MGSFLKSAVRRLLTLSIAIGLGGVMSPPVAGAADAFAQPPGRQRLLDELFDRLAKAQDALEAHGIAGAIERVWLRSGSDTADLLMDRSQQAVSTKDWALCQQLLDQVIIIEPNWAEAWNRRATARYLADDDIGSMADLAHALALEPRHFGALAGMGFILQRTGFRKRALDAFRKALEINPQQEDLRKIVDKLTLEVEGQEL